MVCSLDDSPARTVARTVRKMGVAVSSLSPSVLSGGVASLASAAAGGGVAVAELMPGPLQGGPSVSWENGWVEDSPSGGMPQGDRGGWAGRGAADRHHQ